MPLILIGPLTIVAMIALGVRSRRPAATLALAAPLIAVAAGALVLWARFRRDEPYDASFEWLNVSTAFSGPAQFQSFIQAVGIRASHLTLTMTLAAAAISIGILVWSRTGTRRQPGPGRFFALQALLLAACLGVVVATDLIELYAFWSVAGVSSYLLLAHAWGDEEATWGARLALALPALADASLLAGFAILYSRYGQLNIDQLIPTLSHTAGAGQRALATACVLIFAGAAGRLGLFPLYPWLTGARASSPAALAAVEGMWPIMVAALLVKLMPLFVSANSVPFRVVAITAALSALLLPVLALLTSDARRMVTLAGIALSALGVLAFVRPSAVGPAALLLTVTGLCRSGAVLAVGTISSTLRSHDLIDLGDGNRRLRLSAVTLALAAAGLVLGTGEVAGENLRFGWAAVYAVTLLLATLAIFRLYFAAAHRPARRRRGFDPERVKAPVSSLSYPPLLLAGAGVLLSAGMFAGRWLTFVDHRQHSARSLLASLAWLVVPLLGVALASVLFLGPGALGDRLINATADRLGRAALVSAFARRRLADPTLALTELFDDRILARGESRLAAAFRSAGGLAPLVSFQAATPVRLAVAGVILLVLIVAGALVAAGGPR